MLFKSYIAAGLLAAGAAASSAPTRCGNHDATPEQLAEAEQFARMESGDLRTTPHELKPINVNVYIHVVSNATEFLISDEAVQKQFDFLAASYAPYDIHMTLAGTDKTINDTWSYFGDEMAMKKALRKGSYKDLNIYLLDIVGFNIFSGGLILGYCPFPVPDVTEGSDAFYLDGCAVSSETVPGGDLEHYNLGGTAVHETGHWFGLFHTFQGGCSLHNDRVDDTPAQSGATTGCPTKQDSCPNSPGLDLVHNFMDYSFDTCYEGFTKGQIARIHSFWNKHRARA